MKPATKTSTFVLMMWVLHKQKTLVNNRDNIDIEQGMEKTFIILKLIPDFFTVKAEIINKIT